MLRLVAPALVITLSACSGDCPSGRSTPGAAAHVDDLVFTRDADGAVTLAEGDPPGASTTVLCDATCANAFEDATTPCEDACTDLTGQPIEDCSFDASRKTLRCVASVPASEPSCSCDLGDC